MVRFATEKDIPFLKQAWKVCFDDPDAFIDWNFSKNFSPCDTLIAEAEGVPASNLQLMPHRIALRGREYPINYVSGVATLPEFRHRGLVRELFAFAFPEMQRRGQPISLLVPFNYEFYQKFGYCQCYEKVFRFANLLPEGEYITTISPNLIADLDRIYRREMAERTGYALRTHADWQKILEDLLLLSQGLVWCSSDGYALITPRKEGGFEAHETLGSCPLVFQEERKPFAMARIVDVMRLLEDLAPEFNRPVRLRIRDEQILKNNVTVSIANGTATLCQDFDREMDIKELTAELFGFGSCTMLDLQNPYLNMIF